MICAGEDALRLKVVGKGAASMNAKAATKRYHLSWPELEFLKLLTNGLSDEEIASSLEIPSFVVREWLAKVQTKMGTRSRTETAIRAIREGLINT
jgi:DNA-binding NarL/FixJ family response regulator